MAYFYLVRTFGAVPIIHNNTDIIGALFAIGVGKMSFGGLGNAYKCIKDFWTEQDI